MGIRAMGATLQARIPAVCPVCGQPYDWRMREKDSQRVRLHTRYRHRAAGYVYVHPIRCKP